MVTVDDVARIARGLPGVSEGERHAARQWSVGGSRVVSGKVFAWERPFSKADIRRFGDAAPPDGPILAVRVDDLGEKEAALAAHPEAFFTIPHFDGYAAVLIQLPIAELGVVREAVVDGWLACAPAALADEYLATRPDTG